MGIPSQSIPVLDKSTVLNLLSDLSPPDNSRPTDLNSSKLLTVAENNQLERRLENLVPLIPLLIQF